MSYTKSGEEFVYFDDREKELIEKFLETNGYTWSTAYVCGSCCGYYADEYWVNWMVGGLFGRDRFKSKDKKKFAAYIKKHKINAKVDGDTITAIP